MEPKIEVLRAATAALGNEYVTMATNGFLLLIHQQAVTIVGRHTFKKPSDIELKLQFKASQENFRNLDDIK